MQNRHQVRIHYPVQRMAAECDWILAFIDAMTRGYRCYHLSIHHQIFFNVERDKVACHDVCSAALRLRAGTSPFCSGFDLVFRQSAAASRLISRRVPTLKESGISSGLL